MVAQGPVRKVAIVGASTDAWMVAAALAGAGGARLTVEVIVSSAEAAIAGNLCGAESTLPPLRALNGLLGIDEDTLVRATGATFKLGTEFIGWGPGAGYIQPCGEFGAVLDGVAFHQHLARLRAAGTEVHPEKYCLAALAARSGRFTRPGHDPSSVLSTMSYALHLDSAQYAAGLAGLAQARGASLVRGELREVRLDAAGNIAALVLESGRQVEADLFVDASGVAARLIGGALGVPFEDWSAWLPCSRFVAAVCPTTRLAAPLTRVVAADFGWMWQIPLQGRTYFGYAYDPQLLGDGAAAAALSSFLAADSLAAAMPLTFSSAASGRRRSPWHANCVAVGAAAGFVEPLESTDLLMTQSMIVRLLSLFPAGDTRVERAEYNRLVGLDLERARDLAALHYVTAQGAKSEFWRERGLANPPDSLSHKITQFSSRGRVVTYDEEPLPEAAWVAVLLGQGVWPRRCEALTDAVDPQVVRTQFARIRDAIAQAVGAMPTHAEFIRRHSLGAQSG